MLRTSKMALISLAAAGAVVLSLAAMTPANARDGGGLTHLTTKFVMANGARYAMNTGEEARAGQQAEAPQEARATWGSSNPRFRNRQPAWENIRE